MYLLVATLHPKGHEQAGKLQEVVGIDGGSGYQPLLEYLLVHPSSISRSLGHVLFSARRSGICLTWQASLVLF